MERKGPETSSFCNKNGPKALDSNVSGRSKGVGKDEVPSSNLGSSSKVDKTCV